ncbi:gliding motility-associated protein GldE [Psychroflexus montanilacus]|uniref:gliding motility-associated protein GldE n=1 Tax=Psychroflexus montanilacus TaxID=2873598 RepID=UPI001CC927D9|nr:gliding motility-associated protein GldE [Psychroflexus montanilacus]MBZ9652801.1 gliding motility-associated protein GldE [Psychroflexus montanilacus]
MEPGPSSYILFSVIEFTEIFKIIFFFILLISSALISGSEVALFSLKPSDFDVKEGNVSKQEQIIINLLDKPKKLLATILIANNFINIAIVLLYASISEVFYGDSTTLFFGISLKFIIDVGLVTFLILMFGEILPKVYANRNNVVFAHFMAVPLSVLDRLLTPLSLPMRSVTNLIQTRFGKQKTNLSVDQLSQALELTSEDDTSKDEKKILQGIVSFGNTDTKQVMRPRLDIFALNVEQPFHEVVEEIMENGYSRIPVYEDNVDNITGILYIKDLLPHLQKKDFNWQALVREPYFVPENKKLDDLLADFQEQKNHLAIVVDEYGGTSGLISLEDIIEEIVGDISDEFDDEDVIYSKINDSTYVFEGKTPLKDFYKILKLTDDKIEELESNKGEAETLAGFVLESSKGFPKKGQVIAFSNFDFTVEALDSKRIVQLKVKINKEKIRENV